VSIYEHQTHIHPPRRYEPAASLEAERVRRCLSGLTDLRRESITLAYYGGYTCPEIAGLLGTAIGTVKTRIRDGLARLREGLA
jgi:RNA polymerase sigma-70 factor (ECF subfamily)